MRHARRILPASAIAVLCTVPAADATVQPRTATLEGGALGEFDQVNTSTGTLALDGARAYDGTRSARATFDGGANGYERGLFHVDWKDGDDVSYGAAFYLPPGFKAAMQGQVDLVRWDNWGHFGDNDDRSGVVIHRNGRGNLMRMRFGVENVDLGPSFDIPEGRWFWLEVRQTLARTDGAALNAVLVDGDVVSTSTQANTYGRGVDRIRYGIVAIDQARQKRPLTLWFDRTTVSTSPVGPLHDPAPGPTAPAPGPAPSAAPAASPSAAAARHRLVDRARGRHTTASSRRGPQFPSRAATDGRPGTHWASRPRGRQWWRVDLGRVVALREVRVAWERAHASRYVVQLSRDGRRWWNAATQRAAGRGTVVTPLPAGRARFVQIRAARHAAPHGMALRAVQVLGPATG